MSEAFDKYRYGLLKIDVTDAYPMADFFDESKYIDCIRSNNLEELLDHAVIRFSEDNPDLKKYTDWEQNAEDGAIEYMLVYPRGFLFRSSLILLPGLMGGIYLIRTYHGGQIRKGDGHPYLEHPLEVGYRLWKYQFPLEVVVAGFCHDLLEDTDCSETELEESCGRNVLEIVKAVSNDENLSDKKDWEKKKAKYVQSVKSGGVNAMAVCVMDKICNLQSFFEQYEKEGPAMWDKFNRGKAKKLWFEHLVLDMVKRNWDHPMIRDLEDLVNRLETTE